MNDKERDIAGGFDAKNNAPPKPKDAAGKAGGYEDAGARERSEHTSAKDNEESEPTERRE